MVNRLRPYQEAAVAECVTLLGDGESVLCVAPPGAGKTTIGAAVVRQIALGPRLWVAHRTELVQQAAARLRDEGLHCGVIQAGPSTEPLAHIQVGTVQTLVRADRFPVDPGLIVLDEAHHYAAPEWAELHMAYPEAMLLGLTATPSRRNGESLGDIFSRLVVAATYADLVRQCHLVPCPPANVWAPHPEAADFDLWQDPLRAWQEHGQGRPTLAYASSVALAVRYAGHFSGAGIPSGVITGTTPAAERAALLRHFGNELRVLWSVGVLTEGVDLPVASCILLARNCDHQSTYLQIVGRALRPYPGKSDCLLLDLTGSTLRHGLPTEPRVYSLAGDPIRLEKPTRLRQCLQCGRVTEGAKRRCPYCGYQASARSAKAPRIRDKALAQVYAAQETPADAKDAEWRRILGEMRRRGHSVEWAVRQWRQLFALRGSKDLPDMTLVTIDERNAQFNIYRRLAAQKGFKPGFAWVRAKALFG